MGQTGLSAVARALNGEVNPSGRLPDTYAYDPFSCPAMQNFGDLEDLTADYFGTTQYYGKNAIFYQEGIYAGYRYYETRMVQSVLAGNDLNMNTKSDNAAIFNPYLDDPYVMTMVRRACRNILYTGVNSAASKDSTSL